MQNNNLLSVSIVAGALACCCGVVAKDFRPPAVPLISVEPHFSVWSAGDRLTDCETTHWAGAWQPIHIILEADGAQYRLCGKEPQAIPALPQKSLRVWANESVYTFGNDKVQATVSFLTPRLTDNLEVFSRPVTYVTVQVNGAKDYRVKLDLAKSFATNDDRAEVVESQVDVYGTKATVWAKADQKPFCAVGDGRRADWGKVWKAGPYLHENETMFMLAYESGASVRYFGKVLVDWWQRSGKSFVDMLEEAKHDYQDLRVKTREFDTKLQATAKRIGGEEYAQIVELAWRQSFAACKFVANETGDEPYMFSAENGSGGMIGTTDVFYPQMPHLLAVGPTFVKATLAPVCNYASSTNWPYPYAPHDLGLFPVAEGQYYGMRKGQSVGGQDDDSSRMPVEESGNMIIALGALSHFEGNAKFASRWWPEVTKWANYLEKVGFDPENQLCTDDFAGHLAHNANLSIKTIVALACYGKMAKMRGEDAVAARYQQMAKDMVPRWMKAAEGGRAGGYRLAFDRPDTWSMKYNMVWDKVLHLGLFPPEIAEREMKVYKTLAFEYGIALDNRKNYTKADWIAWSACLTGNQEDLATLMKPVYHFLDASPDRVPFSDWYHADTGRYQYFRARSVVGGVFMPFLVFR